jgi:hypothetical protein
MIKLSLGLFTQIIQYTIPKGLVLNHTIMPNLQHAKVEDAKRLPSCPTAFFSHE